MEIFCWNCRRELESSLLAEPPGSKETEQSGSYRVCNCEIMDDQCEVTERIQGKFLSMRVRARIASPGLLDAVFNELGKDTRIMMRYWPLTWAGKEMSCWRRQLLLDWPASTFQIVPIWGVITIAGILLLCVVNNWTLYDSRYLVAPCGEQLSM